MSRLLNQLFEIDLARPESALRLTRGTAYRLLQLVLPVDTSHSLAAAPSGRLQQYRIADLGRNLPGFADGLDTLLSSGNHRSADLQSNAARAGLRSHLLDRSTGGADELDAGGGTRLCEPGIFAQEAITWMNGVCPNLSGRINDSRTNQITLSGRRWTDCDRLVCKLHVESG